MLLGPLSSHMISNEQHPSELHETKHEQNVNKDVERDLVMRTEYTDDRYVDHYDQSYMRHPTIG